MSYIGQYRILGKLGAGGMGMVLLGEHRLLGRRAAIKTLQPSLSASSELVDRFFNEARATSAIADPGVVQVFDFGYHVDGTAYIVMELLEGELLSARIARTGGLGIAEGLRIARQCAGSLAAAHARSIVHRDLKPENIYLVRDLEASGGERAKLLDFGICKLGNEDGSLTRAGTTFGTPAYMSPEQCRGAGQVDHRADIYALGCVLFHMLTGDPPFGYEAPGDLLAAHLRERPPAPSSRAPTVPRDIDELVLRCLKKSPDDRFASMLELQAAIAPLEATASTTAPQPKVKAAGSPPPIDASTWDLPLPRTASRRVAAVVFAFSASLAVAVAGWSFSHVGGVAPRELAAAPPVIARPPAQAPIDAGMLTPVVDAVRASAVEVPSASHPRIAPVRHELPPIRATRDREELYETR